jgi:hypothetical protein
VVPNDPAFSSIVGSTDLNSIARLPAVRPISLDAVPGGWSGTTRAAGTVIVSTAFGPDWRLESSAGAERPHTAFGWGVAFDAPAGNVRVRFADQWIRTLETTVLALLWAAALWITRKPVTR